MPPSLRGLVKSHLVPKLRRHTSAWEKTDAELTAAQLSDRF